MVTRFHWLALVLSLLSTAQRALVVEDHAHRHLLEQAVVAPLGVEGVEEAAAAQQRQDAGRDAAADVHAAGRQQHHLRK